MSDDMSNILNNIKNMMDNGNLPDNLQEIVNNLKSNEKNVTQETQNINEENTNPSTIQNFDTNKISPEMIQNLSSLFNSNSNDNNVNSNNNSEPSIDINTILKMKTIIDSMKFKTTSSVFGVEKEEGKLNGILAAVYQIVFGQEVYPSLEEKAAHLLYFLVKDHPFADGCKRIAATLFLEFLNKNHALIKGGKKIIANDTLVAITVLTAESRPEEKDVMIKLIMNFLDKGK